MIISAKEKEEMIMEKKLSLGKKLSYGGGNFAANLMVTTASSYITYFYTNVAGISVAVAGIILLIGRIFDGVSDLIMGYVVDKTHTKYGKARPWILWMAIPYAIALMLMFMSPNVGQMGKAVYAAITYIVAEGIIYTALCVPYNTLSSLATKDMDERTALSGFRTFCGYVGALLVSSFTLKFVDMAGGDAKAWQIVALVYGVIGALCYINVFIQLKEVETDTEVTQKVEKGEAVKALKSLVKNKYWVYTLMATLCLFLFSGVCGGMVYYAQYILGDAGIVSSLTMAHFIPIILGSIVAMPIAVKIGKRNAAVFGMIIMMIGQLIITIFPHNITLLLVGFAVRGAGMSPVMVPIFAMIADAAEYGRIKNGIRAEGMAFSAVGFAEKVGTGIGGVIMTTILAAGGFDAGLAVQPKSALTAIEACLNWAPWPMFVVTVVFLLLYNLDKILPELKKEKN